MTRKQKTKPVVCPNCGGSHELPVGYQITNHKNVSVCLGILTRRAEAAEAEAARLRDENAEAWHAFDRQQDRGNRLATRVAELEAQLTAQGWRPVTENPVVTMQYQVVVQHSRQQPTADHMAYYPSSGWTGTDVIFWRPIPPLPPAPQEPTP